MWKPFLEEMFSINLIKVLGGLSHGQKGTIYVQSSANVVVCYYDFSQNITGFKVCLFGDVNLLSQSSRTPIDVQLLSLIASSEMSAEAGSLAGT